jgi:hypothetical protein
MFSIQPSANVLQLDANVPSGHMKNWFMLSVSAQQKVQTNQRKMQ